MKILLTGANGYIGQRLLTRLIQEGHEVLALVRNKQRLTIPSKYSVEVIEADLLQTFLLPQNIDAAYYLVHSMSDDPKDFLQKDQVAVTNFINAIKKTNCHQIVYLSGLTSDPKLSPHLLSRHKVEEHLKSCNIPVTILRSSIIIGSGSASFEIIRDLVEKLPMMIVPKWVYQKCQPIAIIDVLDYLVGVLDHPLCLNKTFEIAGPEILSYRDALLKYAKKRGLKRLLIPIPFFTPNLSSYWLFFITSTNFHLARQLIDSLKNNSVRTDSSIDDMIPKQCLTYDEAITLALQKIAQNAVVSSWKDSWIASNPDHVSSQFIEPPQFGCLSQVIQLRFSGNPDQVMEKVITLGGTEGYYMNWAWKLRGSIDRAFKGVGLSRGKTKRANPRPGDVIDFWRVIAIDKENRHLLLFSEMKLPGEAWLDFSINQENEYYLLTETATFRSRGVVGRLYWYLLYPIHTLIFKGLAKKLIVQGGGKLL